MSHTPPATAGQSADAVPPVQPGSSAMPAWDVGELPPAPEFNWRKWTMFLGPGLVMGASAIGGGEWLSGPLVSAKFGGSLFWLATLSILGQVVYNIEVSRYALYTGEPIFTGKFRTLPGPMFWLFIYLLLDFGSILPYLASAGAIPLFAMIHHRIPNVDSSDVRQFLGMALTDRQEVKLLSCFVFGSVFIPLTVGGKIYNSMKALMTFKLITVFGFLIFIAVFYSTWSTWADIISGFFKFGNLPVGVNKDDPAVDNLFVSLWQGRGIPSINWAVIGVLASMAAISGNGGLTNAPMSNYTRDQGWGMGKHVGAIPSVVGGHSIELSHTGMIFRTTADALRRWKAWVAHVTREQVCVWMPACFLGLALPSMLSVQFLRGKPNIKNDWAAAAATADGVQNAVGGSFGPMFWYLTLFCGFLVLGTSMASTADGVLRRWVDVFWTALPALRKWDTRHIRKLYFGVLCIYLAFGLIMLTIVPGNQLLVIATGILYNFALGFSCFHVVAVNTILLPKEIRPTRVRRAALATFGLFFVIIGAMATYAKWPDLKKEIDVIRGIEPAASPSSASTLPTQSRNDTFWATGWTFHLRPLSDEVPTDIAAAQPIWGELFASMAKDEKTRDLLTRLHAGWPTELVVLTASQAGEKDRLKAPPPKDVSVVLRVADVTLKTEDSKSGPLLVREIAYGRAISMDNAVIPPSDHQDSPLPGDPLSLAMEDYLLRQAPGWIVVGGPIFAAENHKQPVNPVEHRRDLDRRIEEAIKKAEAHFGKPAK